MTTPQTLYDAALLIGKRFTYVQQHDPDDLTPDPRPSQSTAVLAEALSLIIKHLDELDNETNTRDDRIDRHLTQIHNALLTHLNQES